MTHLFLHIPKTAGTSLRETLNALYAPEERAYLYAPTDLDGAIRPDALFSMPESAKRRLRLVMGHFHFGIHEALPQPSRYITMLRDPVDRVISLFHFYERVRPSWVAGMSVSEWATSGKHLQSDNEMVRVISGRRGVGFGACTQELLDEAIRNLDQYFDAVLITEHMAKSTEVLSRSLGRPLPAIGRENVARDQPVADDGVRRSLAELNRFDMMLFEFALGRFQATSIDDSLPGSSPS